MANGAFTLKGFESPEEVQARIGKVQQGALNTGGGFSGIEGAIYNAAAQGQAGIGKAIQTATGYEDPAVKKAKGIQDMMKDIDSSTSAGQYEASKRLFDAGYTKEGAAVAKSALETRKVEGSEGKGAKPSAAMKKMRELVSQGVPPEIAQGLAYGSYRITPDSDGNIHLTDLRQGNAKVDLPENVTNIIKENVPDKPYEPKILIKGNKAEIRLQKGAKDLAKDMVSTGAPKMERIMEGIEASIDKMYGSDDPSSKFYKPEGQKGDLEGFGLGAIKPDWAVSTDAQDLRQQLTKLFNIDLAERSGAAVTKQELDRLKDEFKSGAWKTDRQLVKGIRDYRNLLEAYKKHAFSGYNKDIINRYQDQGGLRFKTAAGDSKPSMRTEVQIRADAKKHGWNEQQTQDAINKYVRK